MTDTPDLAAALKDAPWLALPIPAPVVWHPAQCHLLQQQHWVTLTDTEFP